MDLHEVHGLYGLFWDWSIDHGPKKDHGKKDRSEVDEGSKNVKKLSEEEAEFEEDEEVEREAGSSKPIV